MKRDECYTHTHARTLEGGGVGRREGVHDSLACARVKHACYACERKREKENDAMRRGVTRDGGGGGDEGGESESALEGVRSANQYLTR